MMELRHLRYLLAIAEEANFTRAAEKLFVSQSALSQQIQALEQEVGTVLLDRSKRGVRLTAAGVVLQHHAQRVLRELDQASVAMQELEGLQRGELRVGVVQTVNDYLLPSLVTRFNACYPQIKLSVEELSADEIEARLENGDIQVGLGFMPVSTPNIHAEALFVEQLVLIVARDHPLADRESVPVSALDKLPLVLLANTFCTRRLWEENARLTSAQPQVVIEMNTVSSILAVVKRTGLATILPKATLIDQYADALVGLELYDPTPSRQVGLLWHQHNYLCAASRMFIDLAQEVSLEIA